MSEAKSYFEDVGNALPDAILGQMFGKPCFKTNNKAFVCFFQDAMVFKLPSPIHAEALSLDGSILFDPSGKGRAMKEWVQVTFAHKNEWPRLAQAAFDYVNR